MNIINIKTATLVSLALLCGGTRAMAPSELSPEEHIDKFITEVEIHGKVPQRVIISPYTSTGVEASTKVAVEEAPGVTLNGLQDYARITKPKRGLKYKLQNPILINPTTKNPELYVGVIGDDDKRIKGIVFFEEKIKDLEKSNKLIIRENNGQYKIAFNE